MNSNTKESLYVEILIYNGTVVYEWQIFRWFPIDLWYIIHVADRTFNSPVYQGDPLGSSCVACLPQFNEAWTLVETASFPTATHRIKSASFILDIDHILLMIESTLTLKLLHCTYMNCDNQGKQYFNSSFWNFLNWWFFFNHFCVLLANRLVVV